jgi:hypothetical protein
MRWDFPNLENSLLLMQGVSRWIYDKSIVYVDDKLFFGNNKATLQEFKRKLSKRFDVEFLRQTHW